MKPIAKIAAIAGLATIMFAGAASAGHGHGHGHGYHGHYHGYYYYGPYCHW